MNIVEEMREIKVINEWISYVFFYYAFITTVCNCGLVSLCRLLLIPILFKCEHELCGWGSVSYMDLFNRIDGMLFGYRYVLYVDFMFNLSCRLWKKNLNIPKRKKKNLEVDKNPRVNLGFIDRKQKHLLRDLTFRGGLSKSAFKNLGF